MLFKAETICQFKCYQFINQNFVVSKIRIEKFSLNTLKVIDVKDDEMFVTYFKGEIILKVNLHNW